MTRNLPAYRYDLFIKVLEKRVTAVQQEIELLRGMEQLYNLVKDAMESLRLPNEQSISVSAYNVFTRVRATPDDRLEAFDAAVEAIGRRLKEAGLHGDGEPAVSMGGDYCDVDWRWAVKGGTRAVWLTIGIPPDGLPDLEVCVMERVTQTQQYRLSRREPASYPVPSGMRTAAGREAALAAVSSDDTEILF